MELISGKDNQIRGVTLRVLCNGKYSLLKRPVQRLVPFEIVENEEDKRKEKHSACFQKKQGGTIDTKTMLPTKSLNKRPRRTAAVVGDMKRKLVFLIRGRDC